MTPELRLRLIAWYCAAVGSISAMPWVATTLSAAALDPSQVALAMLVLPVSKLVGSPLWSWAADRTDGGTVLRTTTLLATFAGLGLAIAPTAPLLVLAVAAVALSRSGIFPVADALTLQLLGADHRSYGKIRAMGSIVFAVVMFADGALKELWPRGPLWVAAALIGAAAAISWTLPAPVRLHARPGLGEVLAAGRDPVLASLAVIGVLHGITLTTYDNLFALHIETLGLPGRVAGAAFAVGVVVEVGILFVGRWLLERIGPLPLLAIALLSGVPRWWLTGTSADANVLIATQGLHGLGFGAYWVAGVSLFNERAPPGLATTAQALFTAATFGIGTLASMGIASVVLQTGDTSTLYRGMAAVSCVAVALLFVPAWASRPDQGTR